jgi:hypothetical protein
MWLLIPLIIIGASFLYQFLTKKRTEDGNCGKTVSRSGIQYRLIKWTLGKDPKFGGYCPFFWAFWLCVFLIPITGICKFFEYIFAKRENDEEKAKPPYEMKMYWMDYYYDRWTTLKEQGRLADFEIYLDHEELEWMRANTDWKQRVEVWREKQTKEQEASLKWQEKKDKVGEVFSHYLEKIAKYTSFLVKPAIVTAAFLAAYVIYLMLANAFKAVATNNLLWAAAITIVGLGLVYIIRKAYGWLQTAARVVEKVQIKLEPSKPSIVWIKLGNALLFIPRLVGRVWTKECPIITYKD